MIKTFADSDTRLLFEDGESKKLPANLIRRALRKLEYIDNAEFKAASWKQTACLKGRQERAVRHIY